MSNEEQRQPGEHPNGDEVPAAGSAGPGQDAAQGAASPGPLGSPAGDTSVPADAGLTVDDILGAEQTEDAVQAESAGTGAPEDFYLEDLRRITAEYANYRKRTEANALIEKQRAVAAAVTPLLTVLDDLDRAEKHGDLPEGTAFATIAQKIRGTMERYGLETFGEAGDVFDPQVHEAVAQVPVPGTEQPTVMDVIERGYRLGEVELRPAKVAVAVGADG